MTGDETRAHQMAADLSEMTRQMFEKGGPAALMAAAVSLTEGAAMAIPEGIIPQFCAMIIQAIVDGAKAAGNPVSFEFLAAAQPPRGRTH